MKTDSNFYVYAYFDPRNYEMLYVGKGKGSRKNAQRPNNERQNYDLCISQTVLDEAAAGDTDAAKRRLPFLQNLELLDLTEAVNDVAKAIMESGLLPKRATRDAVHIAVSSVHGMDILLTWNCRHIANAAIMKELGEIVAQCGYEMPILCTPEELLGD